METSISAIVKYDILNILLNFNAILTKAKEQQTALTSNFIEILVGLGGGSEKMKITMNVNTLFYGHPKSGHLYFTLANKGAMIIPYAHND